MAHSDSLDQTFITCNSAVIGGAYNSESVRIHKSNKDSDILSGAITPASTPYITCHTRYTVEDTSSVGSCKDTSEGQMYSQSKSSCYLTLLQDGSADLNLADSSLLATKMERVTDHSPYTSDDWEDSNHSDSDDDHSDSSDDDDPKSQVDRLIERGTLMFMDDENSALSSESESDSDYDDSESDITDVSPLMSATASPVGLSPVLPRRLLAPSPLTLHHLPLNTSQESHQQETQWATRGDPLPEPPDPTNMALLVQAVMELEKKSFKKRPRHRHSIGASVVGSAAGPPIHPVLDSPHHSHLRRTPASCRRKNMSFTNDEVRRIDRDNKILLKKIMAAHTRGRVAHTAPHVPSHPHRTINYYHHHKPANATINRKRDDEKIRRENLILLRKIQEARPSKDVVESRTPSTNGRPPSSVTAPGSCGLSARTLGHAHPTATRKETAL